MLRERFVDFQNYAFNIEYWIYGYSTQPVLAINFASREHILWEALLKIVDRMKSWSEQNYPSFRLGPKYKPIVLIDLTRKTFRVEHRTTNAFRNPI